jgi:hypothetical protein
MTTTTIQYCEGTTGMKQPIYIQPEQVSTKPAPTNPSAVDGVNPTDKNTGLNFSNATVQVSIIVQEALKDFIIYTVPNAVNNIEELKLTIKFSDGTQSAVYTSVRPSTRGTTTPSTGSGSESTTTPSTANGILLPTEDSLVIQIPPYLDVPVNSTLIIDVTKTKDNLPAEGVCVEFSNSSNEQIGLA